MRKRRHDCGWLWRVRERLAGEFRCPCPNADGHEAFREAVMGLAGFLERELEEREFREIDRRREGN